MTELLLPHASQRRHDEYAGCHSSQMPQCVPALLCPSNACLRQAIVGTVRCAGWHGNHMPQHVSASLCSSCACQMQTSTGTMKYAGCDGSHVPQHVTASQCPSCACLMQASAGTMTCAGCHSNHMPHMYDTCPSAVNTKTVAPNWCRPPGAFRTSLTRSK